MAVASRLGPMDAGTGLRLLALWAAFWIALRGFEREPAGARHRLRFAAGLLLGAGFAHFGWAALAFRPGVHPLRWLLDPTAGASLLFVPLGPLSVAPRLEPARSSFLAHAVTALPISLAVARLGCVAAGCCPPTPWVESSGLLLLHVLVGRTPARWRISTFSAGFGLLRLGVEPWRTPSAPLPVRIPIDLVAIAWLVLAISCAVRCRTRHGACFVRRT